MNKQRQEEIKALEQARKMILSKHNGNFVPKEIEESTNKKNHQYTKKINERGYVSIIVLTEILAIASMVALVIINLSGNK